MRHDLECPYCEEPLEVNHDDGGGYDENTKHEMQCSNCEKNFVYETYITFSYDSSKADCLNDGNHNYEAQCCFPREFTKMECTMCGDIRNPTNFEMDKILNQDIK